MLQLKASLKQIWTIAQENWAIANYKSQQYTDKSARPQTVKAGDKVYIKNESLPRGVAKKLLAKWKGPFTVLTTAGTSARIVPQGATTPVTLVHIDRLKLAGSR